MQQKVRAAVKAVPPIINIDIDFQGIIDGIVNGLGEIISGLFIELPVAMWIFIWEALLLEPMGLDGPENDDDVISASAFSWSSSHESSYSAVR